jgi:Flp pilus assembly pilin Flp
MTDETQTTAADGAEPSPKQNGSGWACDDFTTTAATVGVIFVGAALIEVALIPGMVIGAAAMLAPKYAPKVGAALQPMFRSAVRGVYKVGRKAKEAAAEAHEHVQDIMAEVHAEDATPPAAPETPGTPPA